MRLTFAVLQSFYFSFLPFVNELSVIVSNSPSINNMVATTIIKIHIGFCLLREVWWGSERDE